MVYFFANIAKEYKMRMHYSFIPNKIMPRIEFGQYYRHIYTNYDKLIFVLVKQCKRNKVL